MKKHKSFYGKTAGVRLFLKTILVLTVLLGFFLNPLASDFELSWQPMVVDALRKPNALFMDFQYNIEDTSPVHRDRFLAFQTNLFMDLITVANLSCKVRVFEERRYIPQITLGAGYWNLLALKLIPPSTGVKDGDAWGVVPFFTVAKSIKDDLRLFGGFKYSIGRVQMDISGLNLTEDIGDDVFGEFAKQSLESGKVASFYYEPAVYTGMGVALGKDAELLTQMGFQFISNRIFAKVAYRLNAVEFGFGLYPESIWGFYPHINVVVRF